MYNLVVLLLLRIRAVYNFAEGALMQGRHFNIFLRVSEGWPAKISVVSFLLTVVDQVVRGSSKSVSALPFCPAKWQVFKVGGG